MKAKTIKQVLTNKIEHWINSIDSDSVRLAAKNSVIVTGGAIASMLTDSKVNDIDIYFNNKEDAIKIAKYYIREFNLSNVEIGFPEGFIHQNEDFDVDEENRVYLNVHPGVLKLDDYSEDDQRKYKPLFISNNAMTLENNIQLIFRFIGDAEKIHENYDFVHCTCSYDYKANKLTLPADALEALLTKELRYIGSKYPICSVFRIRKYLDRGFKIHAGEILKICWQVNALDLSNINVLRDQLVGVDIHYFNVALRAMEEKMKKDDNFKMTEGYLFKLIDKVFN